jgi:hypothetical protein
MISEKGNYSFKHLGLDSSSEEEVLIELEILKKKLFSRLEQFIKVQIQKRGISIIHNTYTGFDTEYEHVKYIRNKLLSVQTAVVKRTIIKIPSIEAFDIGYVHPLTS